MSRDTGAGSEVRERLMPKEEAPTGLGMPTGSWIHAEPTERRVRMTTLSEVWSRPPPRARKRPSSEAAEANDNCGIAGMVCGAKNPEGFQVPGRTLSKVQHAPEA